MYLLLIWILNAMALIAVANFVPGIHVDGFAAALIADGQSRVEPLETVERGYSRLVERLQKLGASVAKI